MTEELSNARKDALAFLTRQKIGVLATVSQEGNVHASTVFYTADENFNIYIITLTNSRKYAGLHAHPQVAFTISIPDLPQTLQIEGTAMDISLDEEAAKKKDELFKVLNSNNWFSAPITKLDPAESAIVWIKPTWIRWADYAFEESGTAHVFKEIPVIE